LDRESTKLAAKVQPLSSFERAINQRVLTISQRDTKYKYFFADGRTNMPPVVGRAAALL
jgi:hypothetical protein